MNIGDYVAAREHLEKLAKQNPKADYVTYGLAALDCLTGQAEESMRHLETAIGLNTAAHFRRGTTPILTISLKIPGLPNCCIQTRVAMTPTPPIWIFKT